MVVQTIDVDCYARLAIAEVKTVTGRELVIRGKLDVSRSATRGARRGRLVRERNLGFATHMFKAKSVDGAVALLPLLRRKVETTRPAGPI